MLVGNINYNVTVSFNVKKTTPKHMGHDARQCKWGRVGEGPREVDTCFRSLFNQSSVTCFLLSMVHIQQNFP